MSPSTLMSAKSLVACVSKRGVSRSSLLDKDQDTLCAHAGRVPLAQYISCATRGHATERQQHNLEAGGEDLRHQRLVDRQALRAYLLDESITIPAESHEGYRHLAALSVILAA